jgi:hypothetical protein
MVLRKRGALVGLALFVALAITTVTTPVASAAPASAGGATVVPPAGRLSVTLLGPQPKHAKVDAPSAPIRTKDPGALRAAKAAAEAGVPKASATVPPSAAGPSGSLFSGLNSAGLSAQDEGATATPPDSTGAIGPTRYIEMVNNLVGVYDRSNLTQLSKVDFPTFAHVPAGLTTSDPQVEWDPIANRWLYAMVGIATGANYLLFGWTKTADPSDLSNGWCTFGVNTGRYLQDYPKLGHDVNFVTVGSNAYDDSLPAFPFVTAQIWAFPKPAASDTTCSSPVNATFFADPTHLLKNADGTLAFTPIPANTTDAVNDYIVGSRDVSTGPASKVMVWHLEARPAATLVADGDISVGASYAVPPGVPQPGTSYLIDTLDGRLTQAVARFDPTAGAEALWTQQTVAGSGRSVVRWYELLPTRRTIYQQGVLQSPTDFYFNAAISPSWAGNDASISYNRASSTQLAMIGAQTRTSSTPLGQMDAGELSLGTSSAANQEAAFQTNCNPNPCRWGDYSGATPDPSNAHVVWGSNQIDGPVFLGYAQWTTQNFAISTVPPAPDFTLSLSPASQTVVAGGATSYAVNASRVGGFAGAITLSVSGLPGGVAGSFSPNPASGATSTLSVTTGSATPVGSYSLTITGSSGSLTRTAGGTLVVNPPPSPDFSLSTSPSSQTIAPGAGTAYTLAVTRTLGFSGSVSLSISGLPSGAAGSFGPNPASGTTSTLSVTSSTGTPLGTYPLTITGTSGSLTRSAPATLVVSPPPPCSSATLAPAATTQSVGTTIAFTATSGGCSSPQYQYFVQLLNGTWSMQRAFSTDPTWSWNTTGLALGTYTVRVWANQVGNPTSSQEAYASSTVTLTAPSACTSASLSPASASQPVGTAIAFTAGSGGCPNPQYQFFIQLPNGNWSMQRAFTTDPTWSWNTTGLAAGTYTVRVWANQVGNSTSSQEAYASSIVTLTGPPACTSANLAPPNTSQAVGTVIGFTAGSSGCPNPQYQFFIQSPDGAWSMQRAFSTDPTWSWNTAGLALGTYTVRVWANQVGDSTSSQEAYASSIVTLVAPSACTAASLLPATTNQPVGATIVFTAGSGGCPNPQYQFFIQLPNGNWSMQRAFSTSPTWSWNTTGLAAGTYTVRVWANQVGNSTGSQEAYASSIATLTLPSACTSASLTPPSANQPVGATIAFTAGSGGCPNPQYQFFIQLPNGSWSMQRAFTTDPSWSWNTTGLAPGNYTVRVWANQVGNPTSSQEAYASSAVTLT